MAQGAEMCSSYGLKLVALKSKADIDCIVALNLRKKLFLNNIEKVTQKFYIQLGAFITRLEFPEWDK